MRKSSRFWSSTVATTLLVSSIVTLSPSIATAAEFTDVQKGSAMHEAIMSLKERDIIDGFTDGTYRPSQNVTRGQAAKLIVHALGLSMENVKDPKFKDVPKSHRFYKEIAVLTAAGHINGYKDGRFGSEDPLTRAQMSKILGEAYGFGQAPLRTNQFTDVDKNAYYAPYLQPLIDNDITYGKTKTAFKPNDYVNRGQMALFLYRSEKSKNTAVQSIETGITKIENNKVYTLAGTYEVDGTLQKFFSEENEAVLKNATVKFYFKDNQMTKVENIQINTSGTSTTPLVLNGNNQLLDVIKIQGDYIRIENLQVERFVIGDRVKAGFEARKLRVSGRSVIEEAETQTAAYSSKTFIVLQNTTFEKDLIVQKRNVSISAEGHTSITNLILEQMAKVNTSLDSKIHGIYLINDATGVVLNGSAEFIELNSSLGAASQAPLDLNVDGELYQIIISKKVKFSLNEKAEIQKIVLADEIKNNTKLQDLIVNYDELKDKSYISDATENPTPGLDEEPPSIEAAQLELEVVDLINVERRKNGLSQLKWDSELAEVARLKSKDMYESNYFDHNSPNYGSPFDMMKQFGVEYRSAAENIAWGYPTAESVVEGWMNSPGHRKNILSPSFTHVGVGYEENAHHWTQMFISK